MNFVKMKIAFLTRSGNNSPGILADALKEHLEAEGAAVTIFTRVNLMNRLVSYKDNTLSLHFWLREKIYNYPTDRKIIKELKEFDAVVVSECIPNAFWKRLYNVERLKRIIKKPILFYEVFYLGNAPTQVKTLAKNNDRLFERFDAHLFVSPVTEIRATLPSNAYCIGLRAKQWKLRPLRKKELIALVDFAQPGQEAFRRTQVEQLKRSGIKFISLEERYSIDEIRDIYRGASIYFMQSSEAFGLPVLECLCAGAQVFTPNSSWPMSWRLDENPQVHGKGILPGCFTVYNGEHDLYYKLIDFKNDFDAKETPQRVFDIFYKNYPFFYEGNSVEVQRCLAQIKDMQKPLG